LFEFVENFLKFSPLIVFTKLAFNRFSIEF
jgi:hypothetical protein